MHFEVLGEITDVVTIAYRLSIRELGRLKKKYGRGRWRKRKGIGRVQLRNGSVRLAELHWYEASGLGRRKLKIKRFVD